MVVTNEELAKRLTDKELNAPVTLENRHDIESSLTGHCEKVALMTANYKDEQFKNQINYWLDYFERGKEQGFVSQNSYNDMRYFASKVLNEPRF